MTVGRSSSPSSSPPARIRAPRVTSLPRSTRAHGRARPSRSAGRRRSHRRQDRRRRAPRREAGRARGSARTPSARRRSAAPRCSSGPRRRTRSRRAASAASSRSASAATITGVALPSSRFTRLRGARSRSFQPTPAEPVNVISATRSSSTRTSPISLAGPQTTLSQPAGSPASVLELGEEQRRERRLRRRLQDDGAARGERGRDLVGDEVEREVERRDRTDDADRNAQRERELADAGGRRVHRNDVAGELARLDGGHRERRLCARAPRCAPPSSASRPRPRSSARSPRRAPRRAAPSGRGWPRARVPGSAPPWPAPPHRPRVVPRAAPPFATRPTSEPSYGERTSSQSPVSTHSPSMRSFRSIAVVATR